MKTINECNKCGEKSCKKCDGGLDSDALINDCGHCVLGQTGKAKSFGKDCKGVCGGEYIRIESCNVCHKRGSRGFVDCAGNCGGTARINRCNKCSKNPNDGVDACGVCNGNGSSCAGCDGVPNSGKVMDYCKKCRSPQSPEFNTGCVSIDRVSAKSITQGRKHELVIYGAGLPKDEIACQLRSGNARIKATKIVSENGKSMKLSLPPISTSGKYEMSCTIGGVEYTKDDLSIFVYDMEEVKVIRVEPDEIDVGSNVTEVLITGTGFVDTGEVFCMYEVENGQFSSRQLKKPTSIKSRGEFIDSTKVKCKVIKMRSSLRVKLSVSLSRNDRINSSVELIWYAKEPRLVKYSLNYRSKKISIEFDGSVRKLEDCRQLFIESTIAKLTDLAEKKQFKCYFKRPEELVISLPVESIIKDGKLKLLPPSYSTLSMFILSFPITSNPIPSHSFPAFLTTLLSVIP